MKRRLMDLLAVTAVAGALLLYWRTGVYSPPADDEPTGTAMLEDSAAPDDDDRGERRPESWDYSRIAATDNGGRRESRTAAETNPLPGPAFNGMEDFNARFARDPESVLALLARVVDDAFSETGEVPGESARLVESLDLGVREGALESEATASIRGVRCVSPACEVLLAKDAVPSHEVTLPVIGQRLLAISPDYLTVVHGSYADDDGLWAIYAIKQNLLEEGDW